MIDVHSLLKEKKKKERKKEEKKDFYVYYLFGSNLFNKLLKRIF